MAGTASTESRRRRRVRRVDESSSHEPKPLGAQAALWIRLVGMLALFGPAIDQVSNALTVSLIVLYVAE